MSEDRKGKLRTKESKQKQSESLKGNKNPRFIFLSDTQINQIINFYEKQKLTIKEISVQIKISQYKIRRLLKEQDIYFDSRNPR